MAGAPLDSAEITFLKTLHGLEKTGEIEDGGRLDPGTRFLLGVNETQSKELAELEDTAAEYDDEARSPVEADDDLRQEENEELYGEPPPAEEVAQRPRPDQFDAPLLEAQGVVDPQQQQPYEMVGEDMVEEEIPPPVPAVAPKHQPKPEPRSKELYGSLFSNRKAHPLVIARVMSDRHDDEWVKWEPETLWWTVRNEFGPVGELTQNKMMALRVALQTGYPWTDWDVFENCGTAWNDHLPIFGAYQPMQPSEVAFTVSILKKLHPEFEFENEVRAYIGAVCEENGFVLAPKVWFPGAQELINRKRWVGPLRSDVKKTWAIVRKMDEAQLGDISFRQDNPLDVHIGRLLAVREYLDARESERRAQTKRQVRRVAMPAGVNAVA